ncbi:uncharacterized protein LOC111102566 isoform X1 [Crassostrea virginica]
MPLACYGTIVFVITFKVSSYSGQKCSGPSGLVCCAGYSWDDLRNVCEPCQIGYQGENCEQPCPFPTYGENCQSICQCNTNQICHHVYGCKAKDVDSKVKTSNSTSRTTPLQKTESYSSSTELYYSDKLARETVSSQIAKDNSISTVLFSKHKMELDSIKCITKRNQGKYNRVTLSVICACLTSISGLFLVCYIGLHLYMIKNQRVYLPPATLTF